MIHFKFSPLHLQLIICTCVRIHNSQTANNVQCIEITMPSFNKHSNRLYDTETKKLPLSVVMKVMIFIRCFIKLYHTPNIYLWSFQKILDLATWISYDSRLHLTRSVMVSLLLHWCATNKYGLLNICIYKYHHHLQYVKCVI